MDGLIEKIPNLNPPLFLLLDFPFPDFGLPLKEAMS
jgi:hypothetical protein